METHQWGVLGIKKKISFKIFILNTENVICDCTFHVFVAATRRSANARTHTLTHTRHTHTHCVCRQSSVPSWSCVFWLSLSRIQQAARPEPEVRCRPPVMWSITAPQWPSRLIGLDGRGKQL